MPHFVVPSGLDVFPLKPYVSKKTPLIRTAPPDYDTLLEKMIAQHAEAWAKQQEQEQAQQEQLEQQEQQQLDGATTTR